jgi:hypothetical protein
MRPAQEPFDPFATLGIAPSAGRGEIRRAYRHRAREVHPDATGTDTTDAMARLNRARDEALARASVATGRPPRPTAPPRPEYRTRPAGGTAGGGTDGTGTAGDAGGPHAHPEDEDAFDHAVDWNDYWSAWNDPPKRWRTRETR